MASSSSRAKKSRSGGGYLSSARHPWPCFLFLLPLLLVYEGGIVWMGGAQAELLRTGADTWLHWGLEACGLQHFYWGPGLVVVLLLGWCWLRRGDRPGDPAGVCMGMAIESVVFALGLWGISRGLSPLLDSFGVKLAAAPPPAQETLREIITYVGAGLYEEVLFRLLLFSGLVWLLKLIEVPSLPALLAAAAASALVFSAAHHLGPYGESFDGYAFLFRTLAGLYFTLLFQLRGFGVAVGAHACYDVVVGVMLG